jgi:VanZ family protein
MQLRTTAWPLSLIYAALVLYASLFPFSGWRDQSNDWWLMVTAPWPHYWTAFDLLSNFVGYMPLGFFLALTVLRVSVKPRAWQVLLIGFVLPSALSLLMETLQQYLPSRVPSNIDWLANSLGALAGAVCAALLDRWGLIARWSRFRMRWFPQAASGTMALLFIWPLALIFPAPVPLSLGQVRDRLYKTLSQWLVDTPWTEWLWDPAEQTTRLAPGVEMLLVALGLLCPVLLAYSLLRDLPKRLLVLLIVSLSGVLFTGLATLLSFGPVHVWAWLGETARAGLLLGLLAGVVFSLVPARVCMALAMLGLLLALVLVNMAPADAYFSHTLSTWEQGRFARFHGLTQWLGWIWPYAALVHTFSQVIKPHSRA